MERRSFVTYLRISICHGLTNRYKPNFIPLVFGKLAFSSSQTVNVAYHAKKYTGLQLTQEDQIFLMLNVYFHSEI